MIEGFYTSYRCRGCNKEIILITSEVQSTLGLGKYLNCSHCGCRNIKKETITDDLREVMKARSYKKINGRIKEIR